MVPLILPTFLIVLSSPSQAPLYVGIVSSVSAFTLSIMAFFAGKLSDRSYNRKRLIELGYFVEGIFMGLLGFATHWLQVLGGTTVAGMGRGIIGTTRNTTIADSTDPAYYGRAFGFRQAMDTIGSIIGPLIVYGLSGWPVRSLFFITLIPATLAFLAIVIFITEVPRPQAPSSEVSPALPLPHEFKILLTALFLFALGNFSKTLLVLRTQELLSPLYGIPNAFSITILLYSFRNIIQAIATYAMGALSDNIGREKLLAIGGFLCFGVVSILLLYHTASLLYLTVVFFLSGISALTTTSLEKSLAADMLPQTTRGTGYGTLTLVQSIGALLASLVVGYLWTAISLQAAFIYAAFLSISSGVLLLFFGGTKGPSTTRPLYDTSNTTKDSGLRE